MGSYLSIVVAFRKRKTSKSIHDQRHAPSNNTTSPHPNEHITARNSVASQLHALPTELLLEVDSYVCSEPPISSHYSAAVPKMALRATCRRFRAILPGPPGPKRCWSSYDRRAYSHVLKLSEFRALCEKERAGTLHGEDGRARKVCCICRTSHRDRYFTSLEQKKEPEERICIGAQGILQVCPHNRVTYAGLVLKPINIVCNHCSWSVKAFDASTKVYEIEQSAKSQIKVEVLLSVGGLMRGEGEHVGADFYIIEKMLNRMAWKVCPHMHTARAAEWLSALTFGSRLLTLFSEHDGRSRGLLFDRWFLRSNHVRKSPVYTCKAKHCDTRIMLISEKRPGVGNEAILRLQIERFLGDLRGGADEKKWIAQLVEASKLEEDRFSASVVEARE